MNTGDDGAGSGMFSVRRPRRYGEVLYAHLPLAAASALTLFASHFPGIVSRAVLPCAFLRWTGYPCLFCGTVRSFSAMAAGRWREAFANSPLAAASYLAIGVVFAWNAAPLLLGVRLARGRAMRLPVRMSAVFWALAAAVLANWAYRLIAGLK